MAEMMPAGDPAPRRQNQIELVFGEQVEFRAVDLANFIANFRAIYGLAVPVFGEVDPREVAANPNQVRSELENRLRALTREQRRVLYAPALARSQEIIIDNIAYSSPLRITFRGSVGALVVAVILSGGEIELGPLRANVPPIAEGLQALLELVRS